MGSTSNIATANQARGRAVGALFFVGLGEAWLLLGLGSRGGPHALAQGAVFALGILLMLASLDLMRRSRALPTGVPDPSEEMRARLMFRAVNIIQWVSVATAVAILAILHMPEYVVTAIAMLVGLHLFPLAGTFRVRQHYVTGALLVLWALACLAMLPRWQVSGVTALGAGAVLLGSAVVLLLSSADVWRPSVAVAGFAGKR